MGCDGISGSEKEDDEQRVGVCCINTGFIGGGGGGGGIGLTAVVAVGWDVERRGYGFDGGAPPLQGIFDDVVWLRQSSRAGPRATSKYTEKLPSG